MGSLVVRIDKHEKLHIGDSEIIFHGGKAFQIRSPHDVAVVFDANCFWVGKTKVIYDGRSGRRAVLVIQSPNKLPVRRERVGYD